MRMKKIVQIVQNDDLVNFQVMGVTKAEVKNMRF